MARIEANGSNFNVTKNDTELLLDDKPFNYDIISLPNGDYHMTLDGKSYTISVQDKDTSSGNLSIRMDGRTVNTHLQNKLSNLLKSMGMESGKKKLKDLKAPMPGLVLSTLVEASQEVKEGDELLVLEAMKMENAIKSPQDGIIESIVVKAGEKVEKNQLLITFQ